MRKVEEKQRRIFEDKMTENLVDEMKDLMLEKIRNEIVSSREKGFPLGPQEDDVQLLMGIAMRAASGTLMAMLAITKELGLAEGSLFSYVREELNDVIDDLESK